MADFCKQCSISNFGEDFGDLKEVTKKEVWEKEHKAVLVICEGCGFVQVDPDGNCLSQDCLCSHGKKYRKEHPEHEGFWNEKEKRNEAV